MLSIATMMGPNFRSAQGMNADRRSVDSMDFARSAERRSSVENSQMPHKLTDAELERRNKCMEDRTIEQLLEELITETRAFEKNPGHSLPRCANHDCRWLLEKGRMRSTPWGYYVDGDHLCGHCVGKRN